MNANVIEVVGSLSSRCNIHSTSRCKNMTGHLCIVCNKPGHYRVAKAGDCIWCRLNMNDNIIVGTLEHVNQNSAATQSYDEGVGRSAVLGAQKHDQLRVLVEVKFNSISIISEPSAMPLPENVDEMNKYTTLKNDLLAVTRRSIHCDAKISHSWPRIDIRTDLM
ncbi:hypothetical protein CHS0354_036753 [Potamilus streckersoni]|uniref:Uncharacterized protein n=1 Tax=Potamilus streckersoni TaxID=2493646 RepID=A0AAE0WBC2_9BIVA|nr:hypothetical protein CHS0354_036753 [Potamilus streckersoni]